MRLTFWNWSLFKILKLNFDKFIIWLKAVTLGKALNLWVRCAFGNVSSKECSHTKCNGEKEHCQERMLFVWVSVFLYSLFSHHIFFVVWTHRTPFKRLKCVLVTHLVDMNIAYSRNHRIKPKTTQFFTACKKSPHCKSNIPCHCLASFA